MDLVGYPSSIMVPFLFFSIAQVQLRTSLVSLLQTQRAQTHRADGWNSDFTTPPKTRFPVQPIGGGHGPWHVLALLLLSALASTTVNK